LIVDVYACIVFFSLLVFYTKNDAVVLTVWVSYY